jgi:DNA repair photolyase
MSKRKTGTREWAESNFNVGIGCSHNCLYCYARSNALRFKFVDSHDDWTKERIRAKLPSITKKEGWIMFPTTHDVTPFYLPTIITALETMLKKGNKVLIVSKPHFECIKAICEKFTDYKSQILFRFTIGTPNEETAKFWEPGAPSISDRRFCLGWAHAAGFATSVSMEPMLDSVEDIYTLVNDLQYHVTDKIWIGKMNQIDKRVKKSNPIIEIRCNQIKTWQNDEKILWLVDKLKNHPKVEWKDSIKEVIEKFNEHRELNMIPKYPI